jgi:hypothetical protein
MTYPADHGPGAPNSPAYPPQSPYPQSPYPQSPYPQSPYPQSPYPQDPQYPRYAEHPQESQYPQQQPYPYPAYPVAASGGPPPRKRNLVWIWVAAGVAAAVAVALLVVFLNRDKHPGEQQTAGRSLTLPASFDGYQRLSGYDTATLRNQLATQLASLGGSARKVAKDATIAVYAKPGLSRPQFVLLAFPVADVPRLQDEVKDIGLDAAVKKFLGGIGTGIAGTGGPVSGASQSFDPGPRGGAMRCQQVGATGSAVGVCGWGDRSFFAMNLMLNPPSVSDLADTTRDLRNAAEH